MNTDERGQWTSASQAHPDSLCPGRFLAQRDIPEPPPTPEALRGTRIHAWLSGDQTIKLAPDEQETSDAIREQVDEILRDQFPNGCTVHFEQRLWMNIGDLQHSGKPDLLARTDTRIVIVDYKTGWGFVPDSDVNLQLRDLAVLAYEEYGVAPIVVAKVQTGGKPVLCEYSAADIHVSSMMVKGRVRRCHDPKSPRRPGPVQCQYCRARPTCIQARGTVTDLQSVTDASGALVDGATIARWLDAGAVAVSVHEDNKALAKKLLAENPEAIPGWKLTNGRTVRIVTDPETVAVRFTSQCGKVEHFIKAVSVSLERLENAVRDTTMLKGKALDAKVDELIAGCYVERHDAPGLKRI